MIVVDTREKTSEPKVADALLGKGIEVKVELLPSGDYLFPQSGVLVERKTVFDFVGSIRDRRLWNQLSAMKKSEGITPILLIEKPLSLIQKFTKWNPSSITGIIISIVNEWNMPVVPSPNLSWTVSYLLALHKNQTSTGRSHAIRLVPKQKEMWMVQRGIVEGLPGVSGELAERLLKHFENPMNVFLADEEKLQEVDGIGKEKSKNIKDSLIRKYEKS